MNSIMQNKKECYFSKLTNGLHKHHIFGGANRKNSEEWGCWIWLHWTLHVHDGSPYAVHRNKDTDRRLKQACQKKFEELYGHEKFMEIFGRGYL